MSATPQNLRRDESGATVIELAFALPLLIMLIWALVQFGLIFRANSGIQHALGEGARLATVFPTPTNAEIEDQMEEAVYGIGPGNFSYSVEPPEDDPATADVDESDAGFLDLTVTYSQPTSLLLLPGPTVTISKTKRAWSAI
jgi:Flp pilus assembly protein TadG